MWKESMTMPLSNFGSSFNSFVWPNLKICKWSGGSTRQTLHTGNIFINIWVIKRQCNLSTLTLQAMDLGYASFRWNSCCTEIHHSEIWGCGTQHRWGRSSFDCISSYGDSQPWGHSAVWCEESYTPARLTLFFHETWMIYGSVFFRAWESTPKSRQTPFWMRLCYLAMAPWFLNIVSTSQSAPLNWSRWNYLNIN